MGGDGVGGLVLSYGIVLHVSHSGRYSFPVCNMDCFTDSRTAAFLPPFPRYRFHRLSQVSPYHPPATPLLQLCGWQRAAFDGLPPA